MLIILDRDGVINEESPDYIKSPDEWIPIPGSLEAIANLTKAGYQIVIATNQSGVGRGYFSQDVLDKIHQKMREMLRALGSTVGKIYVCPHTPQHNCDCRKPKIGLLKQIAQDFPTANPIFVGDSWRDMEAGKAMGYQMVLVKTGNGLETFNSYKNLENVLIFDNLQRFSEFVLAQNQF